jgi:hypothetical protein
MLQEVARTFRVLTRLIWNCDLAFPSWAIVTGCC